MANRKLFFAGIFIFMIFLFGIYFVFAAIDAPTVLDFNSNDTPTYDTDGTVFLNWTAPTSSGELNYSIFIYSDDVLFTVAGNTSAIGYVFTNTTDANYTFTVQAENSTDQANSSNASMVIDTTVPALVYNSVGTPSNGTSADRDWILVNVTATETHNSSSKVTLSLYYSNGTLVNSTQYSYIASGIHTINWTNLSNAAYVFNVTANDTATNENSTSSRTFYLDGGVPTATATCSPSTVTLGGSFPCTCTGSDSISGVSASTGTSTSGTVANTNHAGTFTYTCTVSDNGGNLASSTATYTVNSPSGPAGSSSSSSSKETHSWTTITPGVATVMKDFDEDIGVEQITIETKSEAQNVKVSVTKFDGKPAEVSVEKSGKIYQYLQINATNLNEKLNRATIRFRIEKSWLTDEEIDLEEILVFKFNEDKEEWEEVVTNYKESDDDFYYYDVEVSSFSYFAISKKEGIFDGGVGANSEEGLSWWAILLIVLGALIVLAILFRNNKEFKKLFK